MEYTLRCRLSQRQSRTGSRKIRFAQESCYDPAVKKMKQSLASRRLLVMAYVSLWTVFISITSKQRSVKKTLKPFRTRLSRLGNVQATSKNLRFDWCWEQLVSPQVLKVQVILRHGVDSEVKTQSVFMNGKLSLSDCLFSYKSIIAFLQLKEELTPSPSNAAPNWWTPFLSNSTRSAAYVWLGSGWWPKSTLVLMLKLDG